MKTKILLLILSLVMVFTNNCPIANNNNSNSKGTSSHNKEKSIVTYGGTQSPGDYWEWTIDHESNTFIAKNFGETLGETLLYEYSGNVEKLDSSFLKFTILETTDPEVETGAVSYGIEIPDTAIAAKPSAASTNLVAATRLTNDLQTGTYNWVVLPHDSFALDSSHFFGKSDVTEVIGLEYSSYVRFFMWDGSVLDEGESHGKIENGKVYPDEEPYTSVAVITPSGCISTDCGALGGNFGVIAPESSIDLNDLVTKEFRGFSTIYDGSPDQTIPTRLSPIIGETLIMEGGGYLDKNPENAEDPLTNVIVDFNSAVEINPGLIRGVIVNTSTNIIQELIIAIGIVDDKYVLFGFGIMYDGFYDPTDPATYTTLNFFVMEQ